MSSVSDDHEEKKEKMTLEEKKEALDKKIYEKAERAFTYKKLI